MASKRPIPFRWWAIVCYVVGGLIMFATYHARQAERRPPHELYHDAPGEYWWAQPSGRAGDWYDLTSHERASAGEAAIKINLSGAAVLDFVRPKGVDLIRFPVTFLQFHLNRDAIAQGQMRVSLITDWKKSFFPPNGLPVKTDYVLENASSPEFAVIRIPIEAFGLPAKKFDGVRFTAPSAPPDLDFFIDEIELIDQTQPPREGGTQSTSGPDRPRDGKPTSSPSGGQAKNDDKRKAWWVPMIFCGLGALLFTFRQQRLKQSSLASCLETTIYLAMMLYGIISFVVMLLTG